jgi:sulfonate transport system ATP-binding protein
MTMAVTSKAAPPARQHAEEVAVFASDVRKSFGGREVLSGIDLSIGRGEFTALLGRSGTGKTTLLRVLGGLDPEYTGDVLVPQRRAVVFQEPRLIPWQRVLPNVALGLRPGAGGRAALRQQSLAALGEVGLAGQAHSWPVTLSGGEAQRVALARALVREPQLMLLDEPFGALDALTRTRMHSLLQDLCERHRPAVLLVTHDVDEAILLADRALVLTDGQITLDVPVELDRLRDRGDRGFVALRSRLLAELGVAEPGSTGAAGPVSTGAAEPVPIGAAEPVPIGAAEPVPNGAAEPVPNGAAGPVPIRAAGPVSIRAAKPVPNGAATPVN